MGRYAYVKKGVVAWAINARSAGEVAGPGVAGKYVKCPPGVVAGWTYEGGVFSPPALGAVKAVARAAIKAEGRARMAVALPYDDFIAAVWAALPADVKSGLQPVVDAGRDAVQAVNAATTAEEVGAVNPAWPE